MNMPPPRAASMPSQSARSFGLAKAVERPTKRMGRAVCEAMKRMRLTMTWGEGEAGERRERCGDGGCVWGV